LTADRRSLSAVKQFTKILLAFGSPGFAVMRRQM